MDLPAAVRGPAQNTAVDVFGVDDDIVGYRRSPSDVLRLILFGTAPSVSFLFRSRDEPTERCSRSRSDVNRALSLAAGFPSGRTFFNQIPLDARPASWEWRCTCRP